VGALVRLAMERKMRDTVVLVLERKELESIIDFLTLFADTAPKKMSKAVVQHARKTAAELKEKMEDAPANYVIIGEEG
jgi:hypothetical protein